MMKHVWMAARRLTGMVVLSLATGAVAGSPSIVLDHNGATLEVDTQAQQVTKGIEYCVSVLGTDLREVHSYSFKIEYDEKILRFEGAGKSFGPGQTAFLESRGSTIAAFLAVPSPGKLEVAVASSGDNPATLASGDGILAVLRFTAISAGKPVLSISEARFVDVKGVVTTIETQQPKQ